MKCDACDGLGYREYEAGLIRLSCERCKGTGEVDFYLGGKEEISQNDVAVLPPWQLSKEEIGILNEPSVSRTGQADNSIGSGDTSKPKQPKKPKAAKGTRARAG